MPYSPGIAYNGNEALYRGGVQMGQNIKELIGFLIGQSQEKKQAGAFNAAMSTMLGGEGASQTPNMSATTANPMEAPGGSQEGEQMKRQGNVIDGVRKVATEFLGKDRAKHIGAAETRGILQAMTVGMQMQDAQRKQAHDAQVAELTGEEIAQMRAKRQDQADITAGTGGFFRDLNQMNADAETTGVLRPEFQPPADRAGRVAQALGRNPAASRNPNLDNILKLMAPEKAQALGLGQVVPVPGIGNVVGTGAAAGQLVQDKPDQFVLGQEYEIGGRRYLADSPQHLKELPEEFDPEKVDIEAATHTSGLLKGQAIPGFVKITDKGKKTVRLVNTAGNPMQELLNRLVDKTAPGSAPAKTEAAPPAKAAPAPAKEAEPARPLTPDDYAALPKGTLYVDPQTREIKRKK